MKTNFKSQYYSANSIFLKIYTFLANKYKFDTRNLVIEIKNIANYLSLLRSQQMDNIISI